jgi:PAT family beta-lactamase induction signal transducer AmpG
MGFTCGAPFLVVATLFQAWLKDGGVAIGLIGLMALARVPYSVKFLWAPLMDCLAPFGQRRRGFIFLSQVSLILGIASFASVDPGSLAQVALGALWVSFSSASQDIAVDAFRREDLSDQELPGGISAYMWGYRLGMVAVSGGGLVLADHLGWPLVFRLTALMLLAGPATLLFSPEPKVPGPRPATLWDGMRLPILELLKRDKALILLSFVLLYRLGEQLIMSLNTVFFLEAGYSKTQIGLVVKGFGLAATLAGVFLGRVFVGLRGLHGALWLFGWLQLGNIAALAALWYLPPHISYLAFFITLDHVIVGACGMVFATYLTSQTKIGHTATQYALLTSLMALPANILASPAGWLVELLGWPGFYLLGALLVLPGLALLRALIGPKAGRGGAGAPPA